MLLLTRVTSLDQRYARWRHGIQTYGTEIAGVETVDEAGEGSEDDRHELANESVRSAPLVVIRASIPFVREVANQADGAGQAVPACQKDRRQRQAVSVAPMRWGGRRIEYVRNFASESATESPGNCLQESMLWSLRPRLV